MRASGPQVRVPRVSEQRPGPAVVRLSGLPDRAGRGGRAVGRPLRGDRRGGASRRCGSPFWRRRWPTRSRRWRAAGWARWSGCVEQHHDHAVLGGQERRLVGAVSYPVEVLGHPIDEVALRVEGPGPARTAVSAQSRAACRRRTPVRRGPRRPGWRSRGRPRGPRPAPAAGGGSWWSQMTWVDLSGGFRGRRSARPRR